MDSTNKHQMIFVGGIHGVGKSFLCSQLAPAWNLKHLSAGELIRRRREAAQTVDKRVSDVRNNQDVLVEAFQAIPVGDSFLLLDGHFCLLDSTQKYRESRSETFRDLAPLAALVVHDEVQQVQHRLESRDGNSYSVELLTALQDAELSHAEDVCSDIGIELLSVRADMLSEAAQFIARKLEASSL